MSEAGYANLMATVGGSSLHLGMRWALAKDYAERIEILERCLDFAYNRLNEGRKHKQDDSEDGLNLQVVDMLVSMSIDATHDTEVGGHCDVLVRAPFQFLWIGEAKLHNGAEYVLGGFKQLSTRYGVAQPGRDHGEIIIYCKTDRSDRALKRWKDRLSESCKDVAFEPDDPNFPSQFRTNHVCRSTGQAFYVRHRIVPMFHDPEK